MTSFGLTGVHASFIDLFETAWNPRAKGLVNLLGASRFEMADFGGLDGVRPCVLG